MLIATGDSVNGFKTKLNGEILQIAPEDHSLVDRISGAKWDLRGKFISGKIDKDLEPIALSDEYWFSWKQFHSNSRISSLKVPASN